MKDFLGNELAVGDEVVYTQMNGAGLNLGVIHKISEKKVTIRNPRVESKYALTTRWPEHIYKVKY